MKRTLLFAALLLATSAHAQVTGNTNSEANASTTSAATNAGNAQQMGMTMVSNSPSRIATTPSIGGSSYGVSYSPKNCNSTIGGGGSLTGLAATFATATENEVCENLLKFDSMQMAATTVHNMGLPSDAAAMRAAAWDLMCLTSANTLKVLTAHGLCSDITKLIAAAGAVDPDQPRQGYAP